MSIKTEINEMKTGGCPCGEFQGLAWLDVIEALRP